MAIPTRIEIRRWLCSLERPLILEKLAGIRSDHGEQAEQDVRHFLNIERENLNNLDSPAEKSLLSEHEQNKLNIKNDIASQQKLYGNNQSKAS